MRQVDWKCGLVSVGGSDRQRFLQGLLTCNVEAVQGGIAAPAALCDLKGRVVANPFVWRTQDAFHLILPDDPDMLTRVETHLKKYALFSQVTLSSTREEMAPYIASLHASLYQVVSDLPPEPILNPIEWERTKINAGWATITAQTSGLFTPQMLGLEKFKAISFNKGCYLGQEIVARTQHLGKLKRHLYRIEGEWATLPESGQPITQPNGSVVGTVLNSVLNKNNQNIVQGLAVLEDGAATPPLHLGSSKLLSLEKITSMS